jgi:hypothetical protein
MSSQGEKNISILIEQLYQSIQTKGRAIPVSNNIEFAIEEPIAWIKIFKFDINRYFSDPEFYFEQTLRQKLWLCEHFPEYAVHITAEIPAWLGHYPEYTFIGLNVTFDPAGVPIIQSDHPLSCCPDLKMLKPVNFKNSGWMPRILRWYDEIAKIAAGRIKVTFNMEWWRGCLDLAIQMRGFENFLADTVDRPLFVQDLLRFLTDQRCLWHQAYCDYFGIKLKPASIGDDWVNVPFITPAIFDDFVLPRYVDIERFHGSLEYLHSCGNQTPLQKSMLKNLRSLPVFEVSPWTDLPQSLKNVPAEKKLNIKLHPNDVLYAGSTEMRSKLDGIARICLKRPYKVGTSGLTPILPDVSLYVQCIREWLKIAGEVLKTNTWDGA